MRPTRPATALERAIARGQQGSIAPATVLWTLSASEIVLVGSAPATPGTLPDSPVLLEDGEKVLLAVFTHEDRARASLESGQAATAVAGMTVLARLPDGFGVIVNPGSRLGCEIPAAGIRAFIDELLATEIDE